MMLTMRQSVLERDSENREKDTREYYESHVSYPMWDVSKSSGYVDPTRLRLDETVYQICIHKKYNIKNIYSKERSSTK